MQQHSHQMARLALVVAPRRATRTGLVSLVISRQNPKQVTDPIGVVAPGEFKVPVSAVRPKHFSLLATRPLGWPLASTGDVWASEDFRSTTAHSPPTFDPWDPLAPDQKDVQETKIFHPQTDPWNPQIAEEGAVGTEYSSAANAILDFWDPVFVGPDDAIAITSDWSADIALSEFSPHARENPYELRLYIPTAEHHAQRRSRWLVGLLDIPTAPRRQSCLALFEQLFETYPHSATFSRLSDLALEGASADDLWLAYELRQIWNATPQWWCFRTARLSSPTPAMDGESLMSWSRALTFVARRPGLPAEVIIEPDWLLDWYELQYGDPLYWRFVDYAAARVDAYAAGDLDMPNTHRRARPKLSRLSIDGLVLGNSSRTGTLVRTLADSLTFTHFEAESLSAARVKA